MYPIKKMYVLVTSQQFPYLNTCTPCMSAGLQQHSREPDLTELHVFDELDRH